MSSHRSTRRRLLGAAAGGALLGSGCAADDVQGALAQRGPPEPGIAPLVLPVPAPETPRVAWVFSSCGPRGFVQSACL